MYKGWAQRVYNAKEKGIGQQGQPLKEPWASGKERDRKGKEGSRGALDATEVVSHLSLSVDFAHGVTVDERQGKGRVISTEGQDIFAQCGRLHG